MKKALLAAWPHRAIELNSIADRIEELESLEPTVRLFNVSMSLEDIDGLVNDIMEAHTIIVAESGHGDSSSSVKSPTVLLPSDMMPVAWLYSATTILEDKNMEFDNLTSMVIAIADKHKKTIIIIPGRGDDLEEPAYAPPKCWLDNLTLDGNIHFYG